MSTLVLNQEQRFVLETKHTAYVFDIHTEGHLQHIYWGEKLAARKDYERLKAFVVPHSSFEATRGVMGYDYIPWGELVYSEPTLKVSNSSGERGFEWVYDGYETTTLPNQAERLEIRLKDNQERYKISLFYDIYREYDMIGRSQKITNTAEEAFKIEAARSLQVSFLPGQEYQFSHLSGKWVGEFQLVREPLTEGRKTIDSRRGSTSHQANPWFAIDTGATEDTGDVWFGHFAYSGNWDIHAEKDTHGFVHLAGGVNDFDFSITLAKEETYETPVFFIGFSSSGFTKMSQLAHRFQQEVILPEPNRSKLRKVLYNSWEATYFDVSAKEQMRLADQAADLGCEMFVVDDGWFGERHADNAGLGDWYVNKDKFPQGLNPLIEKVNARGMDFGIWVEPEMVNEDSDLFRSHPDWVYQFAGKSLTKARNQLVLNFGKQEVRDYILQSMEQLLEHHSIRFIKWDMNRAVSEPGNVRKQSGTVVPTASAVHQQSLWVDHVEGLYQVIDQLKKKYPDVLIETCSGGGGRVDLGILQRTDQFWTSDNTDAFDRLAIQYGCSYAYNAKAMMCWVTDSPNWLNQRKVPLSYRFHSAMMGSLGIGGNLDQWSEEEKEEAASWINYYKEIRSTVQEGLQYRLTPPDGKAQFTAMQYVSQEKDHAVAVLMEHGLTYGPHPVHVRLKGLSPEAVYQDNKGFQATGSYFMKAGIQWDLKEHYQSEIYELTKLS